MNYTQEFPKSERARRGRKYQHIGKTQVKKYSFSPYTAKTGETYTFFADVKLVEPIESPQVETTRQVTVELMTGTSREYKRRLRSGEIQERIDEYVESMGGVVSFIEGYWRNVGE